MNRASQRMQRAPRQQATYYYIVTHYGARMIVLGPKVNEREASEFAYAKLNTPFKVVPLPTKNRARATSILKAQKLDDTGDLGGALQRAGHQPPGKSGGTGAPLPAVSQEPDW